VKKGGRTRKGEGSIEKKDQKGRGVRRKLATKAKERSAFPRDRGNEKRKPEGEWTRSTHDLLTGLIYARQAEKWECRNIRY